ncbi:PGF-pre-PGF domain-containing protein, partial [Candidatus Woesearchaeota archaeon]|nr:PGF-pre-PGF domain-containing protein [Candidatus Woesearchaeota archaeon]
MKSWETLPTKQLNKDANYIYYEAQTEGFSYFAITAEKKPVPKVEPVEEKKEEPTPQAPVEKPAEQPPTPTEPEEEKLNYTLYALVLVLAALAFILVLERKKLFKTKETTKEPPSFETFLNKKEITKFCKEKLSQGCTEKQILNAANQSGWKEEEIRE